MRIIAAIASGVAMLSVVSTAQAQSVSVGVSVPPPPSITFTAPPPLVEVRPGVQVVQDYDQEVYYTGGWYWVRHGKHWYRTQDYRGGWVMVEPRHVPHGVVVLPRGK
jgi:hypothetical protein